MKENEVFSFKQPLILGGYYAFENIEPVDKSIHFHIAGQICEQTKDLPDGTKEPIVKRYILFSLPLSITERNEIRKTFSDRQIKGLYKILCCIRE